MHSISISKSLACLARVVAIDATINLGVGPRRSSCDDDTGAFSTNSMYLQPVVVLPTSKSWLDYTFLFS